jgi:hypothetical protein
LVLLARWLLSLQLLHGGAQSLESCPFGPVLTGPRQPVHGPRLATRAHTWVGAPGKATPTAARGPVSHKTLPPWYSDYSYSASQEILCFYGAGTFTTEFTKSHN